MNQHIDTAQKWLKQLRSGVERYDMTIAIIRTEAISGGLSLEQLGTSEEELCELRIKNCLSEAGFWLKYLRRGEIRYDVLISHVRKEAISGGLSLEQLGTSEEELERLRVLGCAAAARWWLGRLRRCTDHYNDYICYVRTEVAKGSLSLEEIGTSEKELVEIRAQCFVHSSKMWLAHLRGGIDCYNSLIAHVRREAAKIGFSLEEIGTSEEELEQIHMKGSSHAVAGLLDCLSRGAGQHEVPLGQIPKGVPVTGPALAEAVISEDRLVTLS